METTIAQGRINVIFETSSIIKLSAALIVPVLLYIGLLIITKNLR